MFLVKKLSFLPSGFLGKPRQKRLCFFNMLDRQEYFLEQESELLKKCKKSQFFKEVSPWLLSQNRAFYHAGFFR